MRSTSILLTALFFSFGAVAQDQSDAVHALKAKCSAVLKEAWSKCSNKEKTPEGYTLKGCSDLSPSDMRIVSMYEKRSNNLKFGQTCLNSVREISGMNVRSQVEETVNGLKVTSGVNEAKDMNSVNLQLNGKDGAFAEMTYGSIWRMKSASGKMVVVSESKIQDLLDGKTVVVSEAPAVDHRTAGPTPLPKPRMPDVAPTFFDEKPTVGASR